MQKLRINKKRKLFFCRLFLASYIVALAMAAGAHSGLPDKITVKQSEISKASANAVNVNENTYAEAKLFGAVPIKQVEISVVDDGLLVPCGNVFGVKFFTKGVMVINLSKIETKNGFISPAKEAGLDVRDIIISINGKDVNTVEEMAKTIEDSRGKEITITYVREGKQNVCIMRPVLSLSDKKYKTGIWVRDSTAGIGTMTYYNPQTGEFAGLGHGICDVDTGCLMPLLRGNVVDVEITEIIKGKKGVPGELKGNFDEVKKGVLTQNTEMGIYGVMDEKPVNVSRRKTKIAVKDEVSKGEATILCQLDTEVVKEYKIRITKIDENSKENTKNFEIKVEDDELMNKTGGIVQGM